MKKIMFLTVAALLLLVPPATAQDEDGDSDAETETAGEKAADKNADGGDKAASDAKGEKKDKADAPAAAEKKTVFSDSQTKIKSLREKRQKYEEAGRRREANKVLDNLKQEQKKLKALFEKEADKIKTEIAHLKEQAKLSSAAVKGKVEEDLKKQEEALKTLEAEADLDTWCKEPKEKEPEKAKTAQKNKSRKKKITKRKKKK
ncbi:MAG: hypothetical protein IJS14_14205 [Lentisphaeria bacterium]|nr:hypothetical protein [Lentisphaeria bacterium]